MKKSQILLKLEQYQDDDDLTITCQGDIIRIDQVCDGRDADFGLWCCLDLGHTGPCYSNVKRVEFDRDGLWD